MADWLRLLPMIFYAPLRGMKEVRDRGALGPAVAFAFGSRVIYVLAAAALAGDPTATRKVPGIFYDSALSLLPLAIVLVPMMALIANLFDRRGSFSVVMQQEYGPLASVVFYVFTAANILGLLAAVFFHFSGLQAANVANQIQQLPQTLAIGQSLGVPPETLERARTELSNPIVISGNLFRMVWFAFFVVGAIAAVRTVFRMTVIRSILITVTGGLSTGILGFIWVPLFSHLLGSPFLLLFAFFLLRGYFGQIVSQQKARTAFKQNLEAATINPRDSSAHYNLGLIHQQRGELDQARERFQRAIEIDPDELDAHYQLGRIARAQNRLGETIAHFEEVVQRDPAHSQHEIWREIGATYIAANQFSDARDALERFLDRRPNDPQGLYLMGRAHAGLGHQREAASSMQACIEAVKTAPAYKYRTEKRWLNEAQQFLRTQT